MEMVGFVSGSHDGSLMGCMIMRIRMRVRVRVRSSIHVWVA